MTRNTRCRSQRGFTVIEMLIAVAIMMVVTGGVFQLLNPAQGTYQAQPEVSDMQQRMRVAIDALTRDLLMAGAGSYMGTSASALYNYFAPVMPYKYGGDFYPTLSDHFDAEAITILYVPATPAQTRVIRNLGTTSPGNAQGSQELRVEPQGNCSSKGKHDRLCGFDDGMRVLVFDIDGSWDTTTITEVQDEALHLQHSGKLSSDYDSGSARLTQVATHTYYLRKDPGENLFELVHYDGYRTELPIIDNIVDLKFEYFGDPQPPRLLPNVSLQAGSKGPWTTYGPRPPALGIDNTNDNWGAGENCVFAVENEQHVPRLQVLEEGATQIRLDPDTLQDGPWCPDDDPQKRFDADLLRIRRVRVKLRVQVASERLRGLNPVGQTLFMNPGRATGGERYVPDQEIVFDVTPRNMNLGR